jgi:hypothetical protein
MSGGPACGTIRAGALFVLLSGPDRRRLPPAPQTVSPGWEKQ